MVLELTEEAAVDSGFGPDGEKWEQGREKDMAGNIPGRGLDVSHREEG